LAVFVGLVPVGVVALQPQVMLFEQLFPAFSPLEEVVCHPALDVEGGFYVALPRLAALYLLFVYAEVFVDGFGPIRTEDTTPIRDDGLWGTVQFHSRVEYGEVGVGVLG
jgi:hypothetical protein